ncbi:MAG: sugar transferase, partial [Granulosicoccaceae bacterium]
MDTSTNPNDDIGMPLNKRLLDIVITLPALLLLSPFLLAVAVCIKLDSPGPVFFKQKRYGLGGKVIDVFKFRSMGFQPSAGFVQATKNDARVTRVGAFIRRTSIDELPQLFNVAFGDMVLIGPRPALPMEVDAYVPNAM